MQSLAAAFDVVHLPHLWQSPQDLQRRVGALREKKLAGAALDVRAMEPPEKSELMEMDNVLLTPHIAAFTVEGQQRVVSSVCRDVAAVLRGEAARTIPVRRYRESRSPKIPSGGTSWPST